MSEAERTVRGPSPVQRATVMVIGIFVVLHSIVIALWALPNNPVRDAIGTTTLSSYVNPYFSQSWQSFDPVLERVDENFRVRAYVQDFDTGKRKNTEWVDLTRADNRKLRFNPSPGRIRLVSRRLATNLNAAMYGLNLNQRKLVGGNYADRPIAVLDDSLRSADDGRSSLQAVERYMRMDQIATRYASLYARSVWEGEVLRVQYRVGHRTAPDFGKRATQRLADEEFRYFAFGWRRPFQALPSAQSVFDSYTARDGVQKARQ